MRACYTRVSYDTVAFDWTKRTGVLECWVENHHTVHPGIFASLQFSSAPSLRFTSSKLFGLRPSGVFLRIYSSEKAAEGATRDATGQVDTRPSSQWLDWVLHLHAVEALHHRDFRLLWFGHVFTSMAFWMDQVTRGWLIYELTNSTVQLELVRGVQAIPILLLSPIAGSAADRYSRKMQILVT